MFHANFGWNWPSGSEEDFKLSSMYFCNLAIISPWKRTFEQTWIPFTKGWLRQVGWNWFSGSGEDYYILTTYFRYLFIITLIIHPSEKDVALHLIKLQSTSPKNALCQVWLKLAQWFWRRRFLNFVHGFSVFLHTLPLKKEVALHLNKPESPHPRMFVPSLVEICLVVLELSAQIR